MKSSLERYGSIINLDQMSELPVVIGKVFYTRLEHEPSIR